MKSYNCSLEGPGEITQSYLLNDIYIFGLHCEGILGTLAQRQNNLVKGECAKSA